MPLLPNPKKRSSGGASATNEMRAWRRKLSPTEYIDHLYLMYTPARAPERHSAVATYPIALYALSESVMTKFRPFTENNLASQE